jgi:SAM-dependent methyltransferase
MIRATELAHEMIRRTLAPGDLAVDATVGNGHDTLFLAELVGPTGCVFGFDIEQTALEEAARRVGQLPQVTLIHAGHERLAEHLPDINEGTLAAAMFNLGYLPGGDKTIVTRAETVIAGLDQALARLRPHGLVTLVLYPGHPGGAEEAEAVRAYAGQLGAGFSVGHYRRLNTARPAPELIAIERVARSGRDHRNTSGEDDQ